MTSDKEIKIGKLSKLQENIEKKYRNLTVKFSKEIEIIW
jgi:hypothetical protein